MRVAIVGSREFADKVLVERVVADLPVGTVVISGGARGVDTWAVDAARKRGLETVVYPADWKRFGRVAGFNRNRTIIADADRVVAFWDGESRGTKHSMDLAEKTGKPLDLIICRRPRKD